MTYKKRNPIVAFFFTDYIPLTSTLKVSLGELISVLGFAGTTVYAFARWVF